MNLMKESKMIDGTLLNQIETYINGTIVNVKQIKRGYVNDVFLVHSTHGKYIIKCFTFFDNNKIDQSIALQKFLSQRGMAPAVISEGTCGVRYIIQECVGGEQVNQDWFLFGKTLALMHNYLKCFDAVNINDYSFQKVSTIPCAKESIWEFKELISLKNKIEKKTHTPEIDDKQIIHGDYTWNNIVEKDAKYQAIDFDEAKKYYRIYDIAKVVFGQTPFDSNAWEEAREFIKGYQYVSPIQAQEKSEFLNIYAYTLMKDYSGLEGKPNKDVYYLSKRIEKHKNALNFLEDSFDVSRRLGW